MVCCHCCHYCRCCHINKKKKPTLFVGKVLRPFLVDTNGAKTHLQLHCLSPAVSKSATELHELPAHLPRAVGLFETYKIISGPLDGIIKINATWRENTICSQNI